MLLVVALAALAASAVASPKILEVKMPSDDDLAEFKNFVLKYDRSYAATEYQKRFAAFSTSLAIIRDHNRRYLASPETVRYTMTVNKFADLTREEFKATYAGFDGAKATSRARSTPANAPHRAVAALPPTIDWIAKGAVTPVKNQGQCGSCWSFSATGSMEGAHFLQAKQPLVGLSEQNLVDCSTAQGNMGCGGGLMDDAFKYVITNNGIDSEASYPYTATGPNPCVFKRSAVAATISNYVDIEQGNITALIAAASVVGPISIAMDASYLQYYDGGIYWSWLCSKDDLDHGILVTGYNIPEKWFNVKNSWGADWGMNGYFELAMWKDNCGVAQAASYPTI